MLRRSSIRTRVLAVPLVPAAVLVLVVALDLHRSAGLIVAAIAAAIVGVALAVVVAHTIARPLRDIAAIAADLGSETDGAHTDTLLPPRELRAGGELADLAVAIASGRRRAADLLAEQRLARRSVTDLVAHLALRNDRLLGAALDALGEIGRRDHEPSTAAAIARVHRLVARVDRATASALVLIGEGGRIAPAPATMADITWSAAMAIESAERIEIVSLPAATVHADAVHDIAHLVAELLDNAMAASEPPGRVTVLGQPGSEGGYVLSVVDAGAGLSPEELETANRRVRRLVTLARIPTRHLGLDVVGRLARRHGLSVRLGASAGGGVVVRVELPASLFCAPVPDEPVKVSVSAPAPEAQAESFVDLAAAERAEQHSGYGVLAWTPEPPTAAAVSAAGQGATVAGVRGAPPLVGRGSSPDDVLPRRDQRKWAAAINRARS